MLQHKAGLEVVADNEFADGSPLYSNLGNLR